MVDMAMPIDVEMNETLVEQEAAAIERIKKIRPILGDDVVILGHHYQRDEVIQFADVQGDSYQLSREGAKVSAKTIVFAGVHFMAESAVILGRDDQTVILPNMQAGCSMADMANLQQVLTAWAELEDVLMDDPSNHIMPVTYMNSAADLKAFVGERGGAVCTSSNARGVLEWAFAQREKVFFFPDPSFHLRCDPARLIKVLCYGGKIGKAFVNAVLLYAFFRNEFLQHLHQVQRNGFILRSVARK